MDMNAVLEEFAYKGTLNEIILEGNSQRAVLPIFFGLLTSICFAIASLLAQRGYHLAPAPWGAWITIAVNTIGLVAGARGAAQRILSCGGEPTAPGSFATSWSS